MPSFNNSLCVRALGECFEKVANQSEKESDSIAQRKH